MSRQNRICPVGEIEVEHNAQPNHMRRKECLRCIYLFIFSALLVTMIYGIVYWYQLKYVAPYRQVRFSVIAVSVSGLDPNVTMSSQPPVFHVVLQAQKAFKDSKYSCLQSLGISVLRHGITIAGAAKQVNSDNQCYNMGDWGEFVIPVPLPDIYLSGTLRNELWEQREVAMLNLKMDFFANCLPSNYYEVVCNNVMIGAPDMPIPCRATMTVRRV